MGHRNIQFTGHMSVDMEADQGHSQQHPDPCIFYASVSNFPQPNLQSVVSAPGNQCNYNYHPISERHDNAVFYGMPPYGVQPQYPGTNLDLAVATPSGHYNPYLAPPAGTRDFPVQVNHGAPAQDQFSLSTTHRIVGFPTDSYCRSIPSMDGARGLFKKHSEGAPSSYQFQNASAGPSSSVTPMTSRPAESNITQANPAAFVPLEYGGNDPASIVETGSLRSVRNRAGMIATQSVLPHNASHVIQGNYVGPSVQLPSNPWLDMSFGASNGDIGTFAWTQPPNLPYVHASANGACAEAVNIGGQGYQVTAINRNAAGFLHPPFAQGHSNHHLPTQPMQVVGVNHPSQVATSSRRIPTMTSSNTGISPFQDVVDTGPTFPAPVPPTGFRLYRPHRREIVLDPNARHRNLPHLRVLPEDEVAMLEISGYHEVGDSMDQHRDMRLDIDHMSYEELLALGEQIGSVGTGLSEEFIQNNLKIRTFTFSRNNLEATSDQQTVNFCVVCQTDYEYEEKLGRLECGHEYHQDCIKKWLLMKNTCPVCKSTALNGKNKDF